VHGVTRIVPARYALPPCTSVFLCGYLFPLERLRSSFPSVRRREKPQITPRNTDYPRETHASSLCIRVPLWLSFSLSCAFAGHSFQGNKEKRIITKKKEDTRRIGSRKPQSARSSTDSLREVHASSVCICVPLWLSFSLRAPSRVIRFMVMGQEGNHGGERRYRRRGIKKPQSTRMNTDSHREICSSSVYIRVPLWLSFSP
jgi:hypothetical protein